MSPFYSPLRPYANTYKGFLIAVAANLVALGLSLATVPAIYATPFMFFFAAGMITAWYGDYRHSALSIVLSAFLVNYFLTAPLQDIGFSSEDAFRTILFVLVAGGTVFVVGALRRANARTRQILTSIHEGFCVLDRDWVCVYINEPGAHMVQRTPEQLIGHSLWEVFPEAVNTPFYDNYQRALKEQRGIEFEEFFAPLDRWYDVSVQPSINGLTVILRDVTQRRQDQEVLRSTQERLAAAQKAAQMGTWEWNVKTNKLVWSEEIPLIHGISPDEFDGTFDGWLRTVHPDDLQRVQEAVQLAVRTKGEYYIEFRTIWPDKEVHWVSGQGRVLVDENGEVERMVGIGVEITQRRNAEEALRRSEKLAAAGRLAATIAHEINNPLAAITNLVYLAQTDKTLSEKTRDYLNMASQELSRVSHITKQALGFYRETHAAQQLELTQLLEDLRPIFQSRLDAKELTLTTDYRSTALIEGIQGELRQVFSNLISNAIDASEMGGTISLRVKDLPNAWVRVEVEDSGAGISEAVSKKLFEPFFTTKRDVGTGLGLWLSKGIVEKHKGTIEFHSRNGSASSGTCFFVDLPARAIAVERSA
ncbi:MAG: multi-sensor signal transduction histidine kinase [Acidobacteriales bacterium]|nr:multi-sensor signal transduction histidine kinase [Terriglobales bacterium]